MFSKTPNLEDTITLGFVACVAVLAGIVLLVAYGLEEARTATTLILGGLGMAAVCYYVHKRSGSYEGKVHGRSSEDRE